MPRKEKPKAPPPAPPPQLDPLELQQQAECDAWNAKYPPGTRVRIKRDIPPDEETRTETTASIMGCLAVYCTCRGMPIALKRLTPLDDASGNN